MRPRLALSSPTLAAFLALLLATFSPIRAQEPGDIVAVDLNAGIMTLAAGDIAYTSLDELIKAKAGSDYYWGEDYNANAGTTRAETFRFDYLLKDISDDDGNDSWFYYGCLVGYTCSKNASTWKWNRFVFSGEVYKLRTGAWAVKRFTITLGLPGYTGTNDYKITYADGANLFEQYVACLRKAFDLQAVEDGDHDAIFNKNGQYDVYVNWETRDSDNGGVNNLAEWVRGTLINDWTDDFPSSDADCVCGASCEHCCACGKFDANECDGSTGVGGCDCHKTDDPDDPPEGCVCAEYCCFCECKCDVHESALDHSNHKNRDSLCSMENDEEGCSCHGDGEEPENPDDPPEGCVCAEYCCA
ncbi:MAG: hypothetical protein IKY61_08130, partial [Thermoguttaceae bacterium]|nr:hypothetical protein [Thermoguttaceae bacterium]